MALRPVQDGTAAERLLTFKELKAAAQRRGFDLALTTVGPLYRISCRVGGEGGPLVAVSNGFTVPPLRLIHCDTLEVFVGRSKSASLTERRQAAGLGLLMRTAVFAHGHACGCEKAEILAINDDDNTHRRLVAYYTRMGFVFEREVGGNGLADVPHLLVWGGVGTRMNGDVARLLGRWSRAMLVSMDWKHAAS